MYTVTNETNEFVINNSKFITFLFSVDTELEVKEIINNIKNKYKDASHYCYAYIIDNIGRYTDDKEPSNTAGYPIYNVLVKNNLNHVLCIVVRYFGGIKLGASNLTRAYTRCATEVILKTNKINITKGYLISITFNYNEEKNINKIINNYEITNKIYDTNITYDLLCDNELINKFNNLNIKYSIIKEEYIRK